MSKTYRYAAPELPFDDSWDVIVVGGGPAGCAAAIASSEEGARTLLLEGTGVLGGSGTSALVPAWCPFSDKQKIIYRGVAEKIFRASRKGVPHIPEERVDWVSINPEHLKRVYDEAVTAAGVTILFHTALSAVETGDDGAVRALIVTNKRGLQALSARVYVDCTGDADVAAWAGAAFHKGDEEGALQPATHCFTLTNVDEYAFRYGGVLHSNNPDSAIYKILASGRYPDIPDSHLCDALVGPRTVGLNAGHMWGVDNTDPHSVSKALIQGRKMAAAYRDALAEFRPDAFGSAYLAATASVVGIRETRRIVGDYVLTLEDYMARRSFPDEIARNAYFIDIHLTRDEARKKQWIDVEHRFSQYKPGESHGIPYRCLVPRGLRNVLVAGRSVSCERVVQGSVRVMPVCLVMGEAAGVAAAQARHLPGHDVHRVDTDKLRRRLLERGAYLPEFPGEPPAEVPEASPSGEAAPALAAAGA